MFTSGISAEMDNEMFPMVRVVVEEEVGDAEVLVGG
jgi:hypothetical protein